MPTFEEPNEHTPITSPNDGAAPEYVPERHKGYRRKRKSSLQTLPIPKSEMKKWDPASKLERKYKQNSKRRRKRGPSIWLRIINAIRKKLGFKPLKNKRKDNYYRNKYKQRYNNKKKGYKRPPNKNRGPQPQRNRQTGGSQKQGGKYKKKPYNKNRSSNNGPQNGGGTRKPTNNDSRPQNRKPRRNRRPQQQGGNQGQNRPQ